jgi:hypothetical protein
LQVGVDVWEVEVVYVTRWATFIIIWGTCDSKHANSLSTFCLDLHVGLLEQGFLLRRKSLDIF